MKITDIKILWGRAANRCAFPNCRIELSPDTRSILGEIAHIVAASPAGPRGQSELSPEERDEYPNLILLCPTHHALVDGKPDEWTVQKLNLMKLEHEKWVSSQLDQGNIAVAPIDNSIFLKNRKKEWGEFTRDYVWVIASITPLNINDDAIDPLDPALLKFLNMSKMPHSISGTSEIKPYLTRPNEHGIVNEDLEYIKDGLGHSVQIGRNGHCENLLCLQYSTNQITETAHKRHPDELRGKSIIRYTDFATAIVCQFQNLKNIWESTLPFNDMLATVMISNSEATCLFSKEGMFGRDTIGAPVKSKTLEYAVVVNRNTEAKAISETFIKRFVNYFGLILDNVTDEEGDLLRPRFVHDNSPGAGSGF